MKHLDKMANSQPNSSRMDEYPPIVWELYYGIFGGELDEKWVTKNLI